jgi:hypothetical protein
MYNLTRGNSYMLDTIRLGKLAAEIYKEAMQKGKCRSGRIHKGENMKKQLAAAGNPKMNTKGIIGYPRGSKVK